MKNSQSPSRLGSTFRSRCFGFVNLILIATVLSGCVDRAILIRSEPTGARVFLDGKDVGATPTRVPFQHYGTREIMVRWEPVERGVGDPLKPETRLVEVSAPWYQWFPIDLVAEFLWPATIVDEHVFDFTLSPISASELEAEYREAARERGLLFPTDDSQKSDSTDRPGR